MREVSKKNHPDLDQLSLFNDQSAANPEEATVNIFTTFVTQVAGVEAPYLAVASMKHLIKVLVEQPDDYNSKYSMMNLKLFHNAVEHVTRIFRIFGNPGGNTMPIGVGGSGKLSLSRLASHSCGFEVHQLSVTSNFRIDDLGDVPDRWHFGLPLVFLITDSQIVNERFLVYINDMLSLKWIPDLSPKEDIDGLLGALRNEAKANGVPDTMDALVNSLLPRIRINFRIVTSFSPVGAIIRIRARRFPGLVNCAVIDWFHPWPRDALVRVATSFLNKMEDVASKKKKEEAEEQLSWAMGQVAEVPKRLEQIENTLRQATDEKIKVEQMKESSESRPLPADKLLNGPASENECWGIEIEQLKNSGVLVVGNSLLAATFVRLANAPDDIMSDMPLIESLEEPKKNLDLSQAQSRDRSRDQQRARAVSYRGN
ncbi:hypothetical protein Poli38472_014587 [Pythium oligandrum]|uniref:Dynein heavy chain AAA module D4 domain-containing protein n=1 Tax=Pythium oligandrum TaxID=41045 RepID=A0A8K1CQ09_PYTOL|nr:hypothetical protein Poli38472_014587 [Pythium oligandrum]|eukprot:TMW66611.1 hypothetical protein Poli38472_014587 [Pythium oligandrum]